MTLAKRSEVREVHPEWNSEEPRPLVVFSEWRLPYDIFGYSPDYYYQLRFRMTTRNDLYLDAVPMVAPHPRLLDAAMDGHGYFFK
ncbi:hypothetical protein TNCV_533631 [Trichonephila clavipes]|nr:hypothetical protein TNCV_533631 [Trichonephila clavipes]